jgi:Major intrinsic protein
VTIGLTAGRRFPSNLIVPYIVAQVAGAILAAAILYLIASGAPDFDAAKGFAANGYGEHSPGQQLTFLCAAITAGFAFCHSFPPSPFYLVQAPAYGAFLSRPRSPPTLGGKRGQSFLRSR